MKSETLTYLDLGASGGLGWPWNRLSHEKIRLILVEPNKNEVRKLRNFPRQRCKILPFLLGSSPSKKEKLHITASPGCSSIYFPNLSFLKYFPNVERFSIHQTVQVEATSLGKLWKQGKLKNLDFIKIDTQGAELSILKSAQQDFYKELVGLEVEVEFQELYQGQPLFADVDSFIRKTVGLRLWDLRRSFGKYRQGATYGSMAKGQILFGDALYFRPLESLDIWLKAFSSKRASEKIRSLLHIVLMYGYTDYASAILETQLADRLLTKKDKINFLKQISTRNRVFSFRHYRWKSMVFRILKYCANIFYPMTDKWAHGDEHLGTKKYGIFWA